MLCVCQCFKQNLRQRPTFYKSLLVERGSKHCRQRLVLHVLKTKVTESAINVNE